MNVVSVTLPIITFVSSNYRVPRVHLDVTVLCRPPTRTKFTPDKDSTVHVNHGKWKSIGELKTNKQYKIGYTAYIKEGSNIDNDKITLTNVRLDNLSDVETDSFDSSNIPENSRIIKLSCPK